MPKHLDCIGNYLYLYTIKQAKHHFLNLHTMTNSQINRQFLTSTTPEMKGIILANIGNQYGASESEVFEDVTDEGAENIMDYVTGRERSAIWVVYQRFCLSAGIKT